MTQRRLNNRNNFHNTVQSSILRLLYLTLLVVMELQQIKAAKFKGDSCVSKGKPGICREWGECPIIKTLIDNGEYTNLEVVSCGFGIREELICCPVRNDIKVDEGSGDNNRNADPTTTTTTTTTSTSTTEAPVKDFWLDLLQNTTSSTTAIPDFWLELIKPTTTTTTTTTTTPKPLIIGDQRLNESSEFFDFNALLSGNQGRGSKRQQEILTDLNQSNTSPSNNPPTAAGNNDQGKRNTGPVNINQWNFEQTANNFNNRPGVANFNNGRGNNGRNSLPGNGNSNFNWDLHTHGRGPMNGQLNSNRGHNMGRGPHGNNNANWHSNGFGPQNHHRHNPQNFNQGFVFPQNNNGRPNDFFEQNEYPSRPPGRPVNNIPEQSSHNFVTNNFNNQNSQQTSSISTGTSRNDNKQLMEDILKKVFVTSEAEQGNLNKDSIVNIFNLNESQGPALNYPQNINSPQPTAWSTAQSNNNNNHEVEFVQFPVPQHNVVLTGPPPAGQFEIIPAAEAPSTNFIQQPVLIQSWPTNTVQRPDFNPVQVVYDNLVNSGLDIVKAEDNTFQPSQTIVLQPQQQEPPQIVFPHTQTLQTFEQQNAQGRPLQMESVGKGPRSTPQLEQFGPEPNDLPILNVQSPPRQILNPFKPFEFRPPPTDENTFFNGHNSLSPNNANTRPDTKPSKDRPAVQACRRIERGLPGDLTPHVLGGTPAARGEFPHMVALGYSRIGGLNRPPYDIRCGGTLIDKRFVLTAAHCVSDPDSVPSIVRLGVVNFTNPDEMKEAVEIPIKDTFIHDDYLNRLTYNDIAVLELEREVETGEYIYPVCLYTDERDPDAEIKLWVTGWGVYNTTTRSFSNILLKAPLHTSPLENCNKSFTDYGLNRRIPEGVKRTQFCAEDKSQRKDACQGDSGGPLNLIVDQSYKNYRLVGVVSSGFGCASSAPGLYTRVAAFLDFIEKIVWPNGGD